MKQTYFFKVLLMAVFVGIAGISNAQIHPLSFGVGFNTKPNWYANYVGLRLEVVSPAAIAGNKVFTAANSGTGATGDWGGVVTTPLVNIPIIMDSTADSSGCTAFTISMAGKIAVIWRGPLSGPCDFGCKALHAQAAGAVAVVLVNEYPGQGPVGMGASTTCTGITIPVFMIGNLDGIAISSQYRSGVHVAMTITPWGQDLHNDLGFVPRGPAMWHSYAVPSNQLGTSGNPTAYNMLDGAFVANYGTNPAHGVTLKTTTLFTPTGGSATSQHTSEIDLPVAFDNTNPASDSIWALFSTVEYPLSASGTGRFDIQYDIESDSTDEFPADNNQTVSFYVTDTVYSKGTYNFTTKVPSSDLFESFNSGNDFIWGPMYYVANAGTSIAGVQYSIAAQIANVDYPTIDNGYNFIYVFKWNDTLGGAPDSILEDGELELVGSQQKNFGPGDTSEAIMYSQISTDGLPGGPQVPLEANSWYYVAIDVPSSSTGTNAVLYLGCDGVNNPYPRVYGRYHADSSTVTHNHIFDYSSLVIGDTTSFFSTPMQGNQPIPAGMTALLGSIDSMVYSNVVGLIPSVALTVNNHPNAVKAVSKPLAEVSLFPNPAHGQLNVTADFGQVENTVTYEIIDGLARFVRKDVHNGVQNDKYTVNTESLAAGNYFLIISAEGKMMTKKFVVIK